jgi:N-acetylneuraminic acid mutarotase
MPPRSIILIALLLISLMPALGECEFAWERGPDLPSPRDYLGCGVIGGLFVMTGGAYWSDGAKHYSRETIAYSPSTKKWIRLPYLPVPGAYGASAVLRDQLLIAGGANEKGATSACFRLAKAKGAFRWERLPSLPRPLSGASGAVVGGKFYVFGGAPGMDEAGIRSARPSLLELDLSQSGRLRWKELAFPGSPAARIGAAVAESGGRLYVFGGYGVQPDGGLGNFDDVHVLDIRRGEWKRLADMPLASRWTSALDLGPGRIGLFGGYADDFLDRVLIYDAAGDRYVGCTSLPQPAAVMAHGVTKNGTVFLAGGEDAPRRRMPCFFVGRLRNLRP